MPTRLFLSATVFSLIVLLAFRFSNKQKVVSFSLAEYKAKKAISCKPDWNDLKAWIEETDIPPIPGAGKHQWKISTSNDSAQFYFNQGINMYYSFHIIESMASFKKAARFDPDCAMLYWAQALGYGPNINDFGYRASPDALAALNKAKELSDKASVFEKALINAMSVRYTSDSTDVTRAQLNQAYTDQMKKMYDKFISLPDAQALYADAMMLQHPWDLWNTNGTPKGWTPQIRTVLERLLSKFPDHPGGNHYYIHVMEPSPYASLALPSASRLGITNPGLSHVVHMPSHIYLRTGNYKKGVEVNANAVNSYQQSLAMYAPVAGADFLYVIHNLHMKTNNAMMMGNYVVAQTAATETKNSIVPDYLAIPAPMGSYVQYISMTPMMVQIRFGKWDELLQTKQPDASHIYANLLYHFGRGMAYSAKHEFAKAGNELDKLRAWMKDSSLQAPFTPFSPAIEGAKVAEQLLSGVIHLNRKLYAGAIRHFKQADSIEANMVYNEPRDWLLNPKHYLGTAYLESGDAAHAEKVFRKDLLYNNENGWALFGLYKSLLAQKKNAEALRVQARFKNAFGKADVKIGSALY
jgi:tetratricopeptide (TPR) repeat protein